MDLFDLGKSHQESTSERRTANQIKLSSSLTNAKDPTEAAESCSLTLPDKPYEEQEAPIKPMNEPVSSSTTNSTGPPTDLIQGLSPLSNHPILVLGVASDILFPAWQQREIAETLRAAGNGMVRHVELGEDISAFGHDTFLLDLEHVGGPVGEFLG